MAELEREVKNNSIFKHFTFWKGSSKGEPVVEVSVLSEADIARQKIAEKIDLLIKANMLINVLEAMNNGYVLTNTQQKVISQNFKEDANSAFNIFETLLEKNLQVPDVFLKALVLTKPFNTINNFIKNDINDTDTNSFPKLTQLYAEKFEQKEFTQEVFKDFSALFLNININPCAAFREEKNSKLRASMVYGDVYSNANKAIKIIGKIKNMQKVDIIFKGGSLDEYLKMMDSITSNYNELSNWIERFDSPAYAALKNDITQSNRQLSILRGHFSDIIKVYQQKSQYLFKDGIEELLKDTREAFNQEYVQTNTINNQIQQIKSFSIKELPLEAQEALEAISNITHELRKQALCLEDKRQVEFLSVNKVSEVVQKFASMHKDYRETMKSVEGKNSYELVTSSLLDIQYTLEEKFKTINENNLSSLSAANRYTRGLRI